VDASAAAVVAPSDAAEASTVPHAVPPATTGRSADDDGSSSGKGRGRSGRGSGGSDDSSGHGSGHD
jgi:hypothetical protein